MKAAEQAELERDIPRNMDAILHPAVPLAPGLRGQPRPQKGSVPCPCIPQTPTHGVPPPWQRRAGGATSDPLPSAVGCSGAWDTWRYSAGAAQPTLPRGYF